MPENLTSREKRLRAIRGSYEAQRWLAAEEADTMEQEAGTCPQPPLAVLYGHVATALECATGITKMAYSTTVSDAVDFVSKQVRLDERLTRLELMLKDATLLLRWPKSPGVTFSWKAGWSALDVAAQFSQMVHVGVLVARPDFTAKLNALPVCPQPDKCFIVWRDQAIAEIRNLQVSHQIWPDMASIRRDYGSLTYKLEDEYERAVAVIDMTQESGNLQSLYTKIGLSNNDTAFHHLKLSEEHYLAQRWDDCISNLRKFLECVLREIAVLHSTKIPGTKLCESGYSRPAQIRDYLEKKGLLEVQEKNALKEVYALLSKTGGHPYMARNDQARLLRHLSLPWAQFVMLRLQGALSQSISSE